MRRLLALFFVLAAASGAMAQELVIGRFSAGDLGGWQQKEFKGQTVYRIVTVNGKKVLKATADSAASALFQEVEIDPKRYQILRWSWRVNSVVAEGDARTKAGDDYAARVYVVFPGTFFWQTRSVVYIWANRLPQGTALPNSYTDKVIMVAVRSGNAQAGQWVSEQRNLYQDFKRFFGEDPPEIGAIAIMTDTDNTGSKAEAMYGDIILAVPGKQ